MAEPNDVLERLGVTEAEPAHLSQLIDVERLNAHAQAKVTGGEFRTEDVHEQGGAVEEGCGHAFERHLGGRQVEGVRQGAAESAEGIRRAEVRRASTEIEAATGRPARLGFASSFCLSSLTT